MFGARGSFVLFSSQECGTYARALQTFMPAHKYFQVSEVLVVANVCCHLSFYYLQVGWSSFKSCSILSTPPSNTSWCSTDQMSLAFVAVLLKKMLTIAMVLFRNTLLLLLLFYPPHFSMTFVIVFLINVLAHFSVLLTNTSAHLFIVALEPFPASPAIVGPFP